MVFEGFKELVLKKKSRQVTGSKLRIYELKDSGMLAINHEFTNSQIG